MSSPSNSNTIRRLNALDLDRLAALIRRHWMVFGVFTGLVLVNVVLFFGMLGPAYRDINSQEAAISAARSRVSQLTLLRKALDDMTRLEGTLLNQEELARLADGLPALARRYRLELPGVNYRTEKKTDGGVRKIALEFKVQGHYRNIRRFIHAIEEMELFLYIERMEMAAEGRDRNRLEMQLKMIAVPG